MRRLVGAVVSIFQPFLSLALTAAVFRRQTLGNGAKAGNTLQLWRTHNGEVEARNLASALPLLFLLKTDNEKKDKTKPAREILITICVPGTYTRHKGKETSKKCFHLFISLKLIHLVS